MSRVVLFRLTGALPGVVLSLLFLLPASAWAQADSEPVATAQEHDPDLLLPAAFLKPSPENLDDLRDMEQHVRSLVPTLSAATVGVRIGPAQGSGVIVSADGYVLTAAHVSGQPGTPVELILPNGDVVEGKSMGRDRTLDAGLIKMQKRSEPWPYVTMADPQGTDAGDWCLVTGHPGGYKEGRLPVLRLGRVIFSSRRFLQTDCELVGGDSGGPVFNMHGHVIGINSRIGERTELNFHVPIVAFVDQWDRLAAGESFRSHSGALLGVSGKPADTGLEITEVYPGEPAEEAGVKVGDILVTLDGHAVKDIDQLYNLVGRYSPRRRVRLQLVRDGEPVDLTVKLGFRWD